MFVGRYDQNMDAKGRVNIPSKFRSSLGETFIVATGDGKYATIYPMDEWNKLDETIRQLPTVKASAVRHFLYAGAASLECDGQGRALLPASLREYAELSGEISILGMSTHLELWNNDSWAKENGEYSPEAIGEMVAELNF